MSIKELFITGWQEKTYPYSRIRPIWQIILLAGLAVFYYPAKWFVEWAEGL